MKWSRTRLSHNTALSLHRVSPNQPSGPKTEVFTTHRAQPVACTVHMSYWITGQSALTWPACQGPSRASANRRKQGKAWVKATRAAQDNSSPSEGRMSQDLTPQRKHMETWSILLKNVRIAYHLGAHCIDEWNRWQIPVWILKHKAIQQRSMQCSLSDWENTSICISFRSRQTSRSPFDHGPKQKVSWQVHTRLRAFFSPGNSYSSVLRKTWLKNVIIGKGEKS